MTGDRYTKAVLTVIAACLVWISLGGPSLMTPVTAQPAEGVLLRGWVDAKGSIVAFPEVPRIYDFNAPRFGNEPSPSKPYPAWPLPVTE